MMPSSVIRRSASRAHLALVRVDAGERDHHVAVVAGGFGDLFVGDATAAQLRFAVHREHDQTDLLFTVKGHGLFNRRTPVGAEIFVCSAVVFLAVVVKGVPATHFGVGVDVDGDQVLMFHGVRVSSEVMLTIADAAGARSALQIFLIPPREIPRH